MMEKASVPYSSNGPFLASHDSGPKKKTSGSASEPNKTINSCLGTKVRESESVGEELCDDDPILGDQAENSSFHYPLNQVTEPVSDLSFFNDVQQEKENGDLLCYGWPEIENFEDVDKMFRSCDSTFGLGIDNEDEFSWFSTADAIEESNDALEPNIKFPDPGSNAPIDATHSDGVFNLNGADSAIDEMYEKDMNICWNSSCETPDANNTVFMNSSSENGSEAITQVDDGNQSMSHQSKNKLQKPAFGNRKGEVLENGESLIHLDNPNPMGDAKQRLGNSSECSPSQRTEHELSTELLRRNKLFTVKSEDNGRQSLSHDELSNLSNQRQHKESCHDVSFRILKVAGVKNKAQSHQDGLAVQSASSDPLIIQKQIVDIESEVVEGDSGVVDGSGQSIPADSSNVQDSACLSSMVDEVSLEATSFLQLHHVIEKLDVKTKLCIRDSLYRLAKSAEQRHRCAELTAGGQGDLDEARVLASDETDKCRVFMDMETDTNPIDRSIAHLLFHRPSDPSVMPAVDTIPLTTVRMEKPVAEESSK